MSKVEEELWTGAVEVRFTKEVRTVLFHQLGDQWVVRGRGRWEEAGKRKTGERERDFLFIPQRARTVTGVGRKQKMQYKNSSG